MWAMKARIARDPIKPYRFLEPDQGEVKKTGGKI
jgi:hypothetical protein